MCEILKSSDFTLYTKIDLGMKFKSAMDLIMQGQIEEMSIFQH